MNKEDQKDNLILALQASESELVNQKSILRRNKNVEILNALLWRWRESSNETFRSELFLIFADIKDQEALPSILEALKQENRIDRKNEVISILWMSSLNASEYLLDLVNVALNGNYMIIVEVSTVIESFDSEFAEDEVMEVMYLIDEKLTEVDIPELAALLTNLKDVINNLNVT